jgi:hypothetical protein
MKSKASLGSRTDGDALARLPSPVVAVGLLIAISLLVAIGACGGKSSSGGGDGLGGNNSGSSAGNQSNFGQSPGSGTSSSGGTSGGGSTGSSISSGGSGSDMDTVFDAQGGVSTGPGDDGGVDLGNEGGMGPATGDDSGPGSAAPPTETGAPGTAGCGGTLPPLTDYTQNGPYTTMTTRDTGPDGGYTIIQPTPLGKDGFKSPIAMWGNGITTTPALYPTTLGQIASNGFVVIASQSTAVTTGDMNGGMDWMIAQNAASGAFQGKLNTTCLVSIGYSLGGGAAVSAGSHANVVTTVSFHGVTGDSGALKSPLLLFTSVTDKFVVASEFVTPTFNLSDVPTFYATLQSDGDPSNLGHLIPVDLLDPKDPERPAAMAWLRYWVYNDQGAKKYFWGSDAILCKDPWACQTKNWQ